MDKMQPTDEELMALADGELSPAEADRVMKLVAADAALQEKVDMFRMTRDVVRAARGPLEGEPVPDGLRQSIEAMIAAAGVPAGDAAKVVAFKPRQKVAPTAWKPWSMQIAASIAALAAGTVGFMLGQGSSGQNAPVLAVVGSPLSPEIGRTLASQASGSEVAIADGKVRVIATVRSKSGSLCREFEIDSASRQTLVGIGCRDGKNWRLDIAVAAPPTQEGFAPASSLSAIDSYLDTIEAGEPLTIDEEAAELSRL